MPKLRDHDRAGYATNKLATLLKTVMDKCEDDDREQIFDLISKYRYLHSVYDGEVKKSIEDLDNDDGYIRWISKAVQFEMIYKMQEEKRASNG